MKHSVILLQLCILFLWSSVYTQDIADYRWKNRLVILAIDSIDSTEYTEQVMSLQSDPEGLNIRKLIVITVTPGMQKTGLSELNYKTIHPDYERFLKSEAPFKFYLIGLDGGVKFSSDSKVSNKNLYNIIDVMPMRRQEIENN